MRSPRRLYWRTRTALLSVPVLALPEALGTVCSPKERGFRLQVLDVDILAVVSRDVEPIFGMDGPRSFSVIESGKCTL